MEFFDSVFDRQAMAVPTGDVLRVKARQLAGFNDHVFQHFVERMADVQFAVRIRGSVMQDKQGLSMARHTKFFIQTNVRPTLRPSGFAFGQIATHRKRRVGHIEGGAVIVFFGHGVRCVLRTKYVRLRSLCVCLVSRRPYRRRPTRRAICATVQRE